VAVTARPYRHVMLGQITTQLVELHRAELLAEAARHRRASARTARPSRLLALARVRDRRPVELDVAPVVCCTAA